MHFVGVASIANREKQWQSHFFLTLSGFDTAGTIAHYDFTTAETQRFSILRTTKVNGLDPDDFESTQVWYESKDGTKIPMFIVRHKSTKFDGTAAAIQCDSNLFLFMISTKGIYNNLGTAGPLNDKFSLSQAAVPYSSTESSTDLRERSGPWGIGY